MEIETILNQIAQLNEERKIKVGSLEAKIDAMQMQVNVAAAPYDEQIKTLRDLLTLHFTEAGTGKASLKTDQLTYSFYYKEEIDKEQLKAMAVEIPQIQQCFVQKPHARLLLK